MFCWSGLEVVNNHLKPTRHTPRLRNTTTTGVGASVELGLLGKPATQPDAPYPALDCGGGKVTPG